MILTILFKERGIKHSPTIANFACLLLVFMRPSEVFYTLSKMTEISEEALKSPDTMMHMRWYFTYDKNQYLKCLEAFVKSYLNTTMRGKRSVLLHLQTINFDFYKLIDVCFRSLLGRFVPITIALDVMMAYLTQGMKGLFRYTYAIMKYHKEFIKTIGSGEEFLNFLALETKEKTETHKLQKYANKYNLKSTHYDMKKIDIEKIQDMKLSVDEYSNYIPNQGTKSTIVSYEQFSKIWMMLPEHVRIRNAELIYSAHTEGFNLQSLYNICSEYKYDYKFSLLLI